LSRNLDTLVNELVEQVKDRLLSKGLKFQSQEIRSHIGTPEVRKLSALIDHTLLKPEATEEDIEKICKEAKDHQFASVCVNSSYVTKVAQYLKGSITKPIAVVGFPLGAASSSSKAFEAREAIKNGAQEIDMVINIGELKSRNYGLVLADIQAVVDASKPYIVKVILETALLAQEEKIIACALAKAAGAAFVKTSTGFGSGGATLEDVALMRKVVGPEIGVKASGGIKTTEDVLKMIEAGATRIGTSSSVAIVKGIDATTSKPSTQTDSLFRGPTEHTSALGGHSTKRKPFSELPYKAGVSPTETLTGNKNSNPPTPKATNNKKSQKGGDY